MGISSVTGTSAMSTSPRNGAVASFVDDCCVYMNNCHHSLSSCIGVSAALAADAAAAARGECYQGANLYGGRFLLHFCRGGEGSLA